MPKKYIDAEKLTQALGAKCDGCKDKWTDYCTTCCDVVQLIEMIDNADEADIIEVFRCKDCKWYSPYIGCDKIDGLVGANEDSYCSRGEPKEENDATLHRR